MFEITVNNNVVRVGEEDFDLLALRWVINNGYARHHYTEDKKHHYILMHRVILERKLGRGLSRVELCDHIDGNRLNNTRENLRLANQSQNCSNRGKQKNNTSGYKGVTYSKQMSKWVAQIGHEGKIMYLGIFSSPELAHKAYLQAAKQLKKDFANTST